MAGGDVYVRKVSSQEAREGYILVLKSRLASFPPVGRAFGLTHAGATRRAKVESVPCTCRGPEKPHEHYFIRCDGLKRGDMVRIQPDATKAGHYLLTVGRR